MHRFEVFIQQNQERFLAELQEFCRRPSIAAQGIGIDETAEFVAERLRQAESEARIIPIEGGAPVVYGQIGAGDKTLLIYNHYDVQPPEPLDLWESGPFEAAIRHGRVFARGVTDNKGPLMARIQAIEAYQAVFGELPLKIKFVIEGEEEIGSPNLARFVAENRGLLEDANACLWEGPPKDPAGRPVISLGMKGICYLELSVTGANSDLPSWWATLISNPAWRLTWALSSLKDQNERITIDGLMDHVIEPNEQEWALLRRMPLEEEQIKKDFGITSFVRGLTGVEANKRHRFEPTCTICGFVSGYTGPGSKTVLPNKATAKVDIRLVPNLTPDLVCRLVREHLDKRGFTDVEMTPLSQSYPYKSQVDHPWVRRIIEVAREVYGQPPMVGQSPAGGPMYELCGRLGIPGISAGGVGHSKSNVHAPNENMFIEDYFKAITFTGHLIRALAEV